LLTPECRGIIRQQGNTNTREEEMAVFGDEVLTRWPHIRRWLWVEPSGWVEYDYLSWSFVHRGVDLPNVELAAAYEEWADFHEWRLVQRADELAEDEGKRGLVAEWTESMAYCLRRCAAKARGEDPGPPVPQWERRPDLAAAKQARVAKIIAELDAREPAEEPTRLQVSLAG
jgi:hypothetical protein